MSPDTWLNLAAVGAFLVLAAPPLGACLALLV